MLVSLDSTMCYIQLSPSSPYFFPLKILSIIHVQYFYVLSLKHAFRKPNFLFLGTLLAQSNIIPQEMVADLAASKFSTACQILYAIIA